MKRKRILVLFPKDWDRLQFGQARFEERYDFVYAGFDLFSFPGNVRLLDFSIHRFVEQVAKRAARQRIDAVISNNEQFGTLAAAAVAQRLGLPGNAVSAVLLAQHKYHARQAMAEVAPEAVPPFAVFPYTVSRPEEVGLAPPYFAKPVKATFSVLARRIDRFEELLELLRFKPLERYIIKRLVKPFNDLMRRDSDFAIDAHHMIAEGLLEGIQVNMDGFLDDGRLRIVGIIDEHFYPGTNHFSRFEYPSVLPAAVQGRMAELAGRVLARIGYRHGFFNMEFAWDPLTDRIGIVEINPRLASQLAYLYECVDGLNLHDMVLDLALGESPRVEPSPQSWTRAASFVYRKFDGSGATPPTAEMLSRVGRDFPQAQLMQYHKRGAALRREMKWLGSHRYGVLNLCGLDTEDLDRRYLAITRLLGFEREGARAPERAKERERVSVGPRRQALG